MHAVKKQSEREGERERGKRPSQHKTQKRKAAKQAVASRQ